MINSISKKQRGLKYFSPELYCLEFHLEQGWRPEQLCDERCFKNPFSKSEMFDLILQLNRRKSCFYDN